MHEERLRNVLNSLSHLADHGEIPVHAFGTLLRSAKTDVITEHLHQKWLSDSNFARIAAQIVFHFHNLDSHDVNSITSGCLAHVLRDYKCRNEIRKANKQMFRNYSRTLAEFYSVYKNIDLCLSQTLISPLFTCLDCLIMVNPDDEDVKCASQIIILYGHYLNEQSNIETTQLVMKCRHLLCSTNITTTDETKSLLIAISDLWYTNWDKTKLPEILLNYHEEKLNFIDYFSEFNSKRLNSYNFERSRSSSGYDSPARNHPLQTVTGTKRINLNAERYSENSNSSPISELTENDDEDMETIV